MQYNNKYKHRVPEKMPRNRRVAADSLCVHPIDNQITLAGVTASIRDDHQIQCWNAFSRNTKELRKGPTTNPIILIIK
jgi:hypothetical protein